MATEAKNNGRNCPSFGNVAYRLTSTLNKPSCQPLRNGFQDSKPRCKSTVTFILMQSVRGLGPFTLLEIAQPIFPDARIQASKHCPNPGTRPYNVSEGALTPYACHPFGSTCLAIVTTKEASGAHEACENRSVSNAFYLMHIRTHLCVRQIGDPFKQSGFKRGGMKRVGLALGGTSFFPVSRAQHQAASGRSSTVASQSR